LLPAEHQIVVVSPNPEWNWVPSNVWVGVGQMAEKEVTFDLAEIYKKTRIDFKQAKGIAIHPEGSSTLAKPYVTIESTLSSTAGQMESIEYDYLINATGPKLNFGATEGLGPDHGHTVSVCTAAHASEANHKLQIIIEALKRGEKKTIVIGTGHGTCTCQGAAFEYIYNVDHVLREAGVRQHARIVWISNEYELGDFGWAAFTLSVAAISPTVKLLQSLSWWKEALSGSSGHTRKKLKLARSITKHWTVLFMS
jgi:sulfide:quinone oxidoreductase